MAVLTGAIEAEEEAGAMTVTGAALVVNATVVIITAVVVVLVLGLGPRMTTATIVLQAARVGVLETMIDVTGVIEILVDAVQPQRVAVKAPNLQRTNVIGVPFLYSNWQRG